ncbi:MAG: cadherin repeat domain-containing protein, partial [Sulfurimonas sp.]
VMKFFRLKYIVLALLFQVFFSTALSAVQLVNEGFDTSSSVDSWTKSSNAYWTQYSGNGYLFLDQYDSAYKTYNFGAAYAYQPLSVSIYWCATYAWESNNDYLRVRINDTSDYTDYDDGGCQTYSFTAYADSSGDFKIEFSPRANKSDEDAYIDWFTIDGTPLAPPVVNDTTYSASIFSTIGTTVGTLSASNNPTSFQITGGDSSVFAIDNSGVITTKTLLDHNTSTVYSLTVEAANAQGSDTATVTINLVDPSPVLSDVNFTVETNAPIGTVVGTVPSTNSPTSFSILSGDTTKFSINNSGVISTISAMETNTSIVYTLDINGSNADGYDTATIT